MKAWVAVLWVGMLALAGCQSDKGFAPSHQDKVIETELKGGIIHIDDNPADFPGNRAVIRWELGSKAQAAGCRFPEKGIEFDPKPASGPLGCPLGDPRKAFHNCKPMGHGDLKFQCVRKPGGFEHDACYKYTARLKCAAGDLELDPWVRNR